MKILIVSSTQKEIAILLNNYDFVQHEENFYHSEFCDVLISGIGIHSMTFQLTKCLLKNNYDLVINSGIAGSFNRKLKLGELVNVTKDCFADFGIETGSSYKSIFEQGLIDKNEFPFKDSWLINKSKSLTQLNSATSITVNTVSGNESTILLRKEKYNADIESMEGAAFAYVCEMNKVSYLQIRSISNVIDIREQQKWDIELAIQNLNSELITLISNLK